MDKKDILEKHQFKSSLKARLEWYENWLRDFLDCYMHDEITNKVYEKFYSKMPTLSFILKIYYLPTNIINYILKVKKIYDYNWCLKEIEVLEKEIYEDKIKS